MRKLKTIVGALVTLAVWLYLGDMAEAQTFQCAGQGATYDIVVPMNGPDAAFVTVKAREPVLARPDFALHPQRTGSGTAYANEFAQFRAKGADAFIEIDGQHVPCVAIAGSGGAAPPSGPEEPVAKIGTGQSLGGKVRAGPGLEYPQIDSLPEGAPIGIIRNTGIGYNGYDWFEIRIGDTRGFQWGGIICSELRPIAGVYQQCGASASGQFRQPAGRPFPTGQPQAGGGMCVVFQHVDFQGWNFTLAPNTVYAQFSHGQHNDNASSAIVPQGCRLRLFEHWDFQGYMHEYGLGGHPRLQVNDQYSSAMCLCN